MKKFEKLSLRRVFTHNIYAVVVFLGENFIGELCQDVDGFYYFWPEGDSSSGCWSEEILTELLFKMKELNDPARDNLAQMAQEKVFGAPFDEDLSKTS